MKTRLMFGLVYLLLNPFGNYANYNPNNKFKLLYVFVAEDDSINKDVLKLYENNTYEFLFFQKQKGKAKVKREKGKYKIRKGKLILKSETKKEYKSHPNQFKWIANKGLCKFSLLKHSENEIDLLYKESKDDKFWQPSYIDPNFGEISSDPKLAKKIIDKKTDYVPVRALSDNSKKSDGNSIEDGIVEIESLGKDYVSRDSLKCLKAIIVVGPVEKKYDEWQIEEKKKLAKYLRGLGIKVVEFYPPNDKWESIVLATNGASIFIYSGHGSNQGINYDVGGICLTNNIYSSQEIADNFKLNRNALVIFNSVCGAAGSSASDESDIGKTEAFKRVSEYAYPFYKLNAGAYYANNYTGSVIPFLESFFKHGTVKSIYKKQASQYQKIQGFIPFQYAEKFEVGVAAEDGSNKMKTIYETIGNKTRVKKIKDFKSYDVAYVAKPNYTVVDLFK